MGPRGGRRAFEDWRRSSFAERAAACEAPPPSSGSGARTSPGSWPSRWASRSPRAGPRSRSAPGCATTTRSTRAALLARGRAGADGRRAELRALTSPLGPVLAVMPWNFPFWQVFRFAAPALMAGNVGLLKHASNVSGCALAIEEVFARRGFPAGASGRCSSARRAVAEPHRAPARSRPSRSPAATPAGTAGRGEAGPALKKTVLELGGSDPYIILEDADLEGAARGLRRRPASINAGQSCIAAKRFIVVEPVRGEFTERFVERMRADGGRPARRRRPMSARRRAATCGTSSTARCEESVAAGRAALLGGQMPDGPGPSTRRRVLAGVAPGMPAYDEELFGPVAAIIAARDEEDAIRIANDTRLRPRRGRLHARPRARASGSPPTSSRPAPASSTPS